MRSLVFEGSTWAVYEQLREKDKKLHKALCRQLKEMLRADPASGMGKPEQLKHRLYCLQPRQTSQKNRVKYKFDNQYVYIFPIGGHYDQNPYCLIMFIAAYCLRASIVYRQVAELAPLPPCLLWVCQGLAARRAVYQVVIFFRDSPKEYRLRLNPHPVGASECLLRLQVTPSPGVEPLRRLITMETTRAGQK